MPLDRTALPILLGTATDGGERAVYRVRAIYVDDSDDVPQRAYEIARSLNSYCRAQPSVANKIVPRP